MACKDKCCIDRLSDMNAADVQPAYVDASDWLESVGAKSIACAKWTSEASDETSSPLLVDDLAIDKGNNIISATLSGGDAGEMYSVTVDVETCEGYKVRYCFQQYILNC